MLQSMRLADAMQSSSTFCRAATAQITLSVQSPYKKSVQHHFLDAYAASVSAIMQAHPESQTDSADGIAALHACLVTMVRQRRAVHAALPHTAKGVMTATAVFQRLQLSALSATSTTCKVSNTLPFARHK